MRQVYSNSLFILGPYRTYFVHKLDNYVGLAPTYSAAVRLQLRNLKLHIDVWPLTFLSSKLAYWLLLVRETFLSILFFYAFSFSTCRYGTSDCNPEIEFSIPASGIENFVIPGSRFETRLKE